MPGALPIVYLILGSAGSGRREILADLLDEGSGIDAGDAVLLFKDEAADPADARLGEFGRWGWNAAGAIEAEIPDGASRVFVVSNGRGNPVDQVEAFKPWLEGAGGELGRILSVVDCRLASAHPPMVAWYEACIHFSDVVLLARREGVENKWLSGFQKRFEDQFMPCLFLFAKAGRALNPALILDPQARRLSHYLDEEQEWIITDSEGEEIDPHEDDGEGGEEEEEISAALEVDPYLERRVEGGRRVRELPDVRKFLPPAAGA